jgi:hypothetical protein
VIRLHEQQQANDNGQEQPRRSAIVIPQPKPTMLAHLLDRDWSEARSTGAGRMPPGRCSARSCAGLVAMAEDPLARYCAFGGPSA